MKPAEPDKQILYDEVGPDDTPLPPAVPHHVADPTTSPARVAISELGEDPAAVADPAESEDTRPGPASAADVTGLAQAARRITDLMSDLKPGVVADEVDLAAELETRQRPRIDAAELQRISLPPPTVPVDRVASEDLGDPPTPVPGTGDDDLTIPRERARSDED